MDKETKSLVWLEVRIMKLNHDWELLCLVDYYNGIELVLYHKNTLVLNGIFN